MCIQASSTYYLCKAQQLLVGDLQVFPAQLGLSQLAVDGCQPLAQFMDVLLRQTMANGKCKATVERL